MSRCHPRSNLKKESLTCHKTVVVNLKAHVDYSLPMLLSVTTNSRLDNKSLEVPLCRLSLPPCSSNTRSKALLETLQYITRVETKLSSPTTTRRNQLRHSSHLVHSRIFIFHLTTSLRRVWCQVLLMQQSTSAPILQDHDRTHRIIPRVLLQHREEILRPLSKRIQESRCHSK